MRRWTAYRSSSARRTSARANARCARPKPGVASADVRQQLSSEALRKVRRPNAAPTTNASRVSWPYSVAIRRLRSRLARARDARCVVNARVHKGLYARACTRLTRLHARRVRARCLPEPLGPVPMPENEASGERFVRRSPLAIYCRTITYVERATGLEPSDVQLGKEAEKQELNSVRANSPLKTRCFVRRSPTTSLRNRRRTGPATGPTFATYQARKYSRSLG